MPPNPGEIFAAIVVIPMLAAVLLAATGHPYQWLIDALPAIIKFGFVAALVTILAAIVAGIADSI